MPAAQRKLDSLQGEIDRLLAQESDAATAKARWQAALQSVRARSERFHQCERDALEIEVWMGNAQAAEARPRARAGASLTPSECERLQAMQTMLDSNTLGGWQGREREASAELEQQASRLTQRLRHQGSGSGGLPGTHLLVVENERCAHALPELPCTVAVIGAGLDLDWLGSEVWRGKYVAYWGDLDSWGLRMLAQARHLRPTLSAVLMERAVFDSFAALHAAAEPMPADAEAPTTLGAPEQALYRHLLAQERGLLEQEFVPPEQVHAALHAWRSVAEAPMPT